VRFVDPPGAVAACAGLPAECESSVRRVPSPPRPARPWRGIR